jgi:hypothetical protein
LLTLEPADDAKINLRLSAAARNMCEQINLVHCDKQVAEFAPLVNVEALLSLMRQLIKTAESPDAIVAPAKLVDPILNELWVQM